MAKTQAGFTITENVQTLLPGYENQLAERAIKPGHGEGLFVVIKATLPY